MAGASACWRRRGTLNVTIDHASKLTQDQRDMLNFFRFGYEHNIEWY
jgi:hypothetical protein